MVGLTLKIFYQTMNKTLNEKAFDYIFSNYPHSDVSDEQRTTNIHLYKSYISGYRQAINDSTDWLSKSDTLKEPHMVEKYREEFDKNDNGSMNNIDDNKNITFSEELDNKEERTIALKKLRDHMLGMVHQWYNYYNVTKPEDVKESFAKMRELEHVFKLRMQDYDMFMNNMEADWDLNFQDYGLYKLYNK